VSENREIKISKASFLPVLEPEGKEVTRGWVKLRGKGLCNLYFPPDINNLIKRWKVRREGHVARMGEKRNV
jgi:hypothetical protein